MGEENEYSIREVLMRRDGLSGEEADQLIAEAREELAEGRDPEEICADWFGLEPDYIWDLVEQA
jgi:hypothetical protein